MYNLSSSSGYISRIHLFYLHIFTSSPTLNQENIPSCPLSASSILGVSVSTDSVSLDAQADYLRLKFRYREPKNRRNKLLAMKAEKMPRSRQRWSKFNCRGA